MEEEDDELLFSRLGVTSANPEDIEHDLLKKVEVASAGNYDKEESVGEDGISSSSKQIILHNKLRAVDVEINAIASTIQCTNTVCGSENDISGTDVPSGDVKRQHVCTQAGEEACSLREAVATERLMSLEITKAQLRDEIAKLDKVSSSSKTRNGNILDSLVKEVPKRNQRAKETKPSVKDRRKHKIVAYNGDDDFDAVLDAAATGFVETERDELIRKGILTPFHKLKGFERRIQQPAAAVKQDLEGDGGNEEFAAASIAKVAQSISDIAKARPTTRLLDAESLPALDRPTWSFQRLKPPLKRPLSPDSASEKKQRRKKLKRPLPDRKWIKKITQEDQLSKGTDEKEVENSANLDSDSEHSEETEGLNNTESYIVLEGGLKIPDGIYSNLFDYQKIGVQWLWELHCQRAGGIIGDEMGLGKTVQVISFLASLHFSGMYKPSIIICPVTLLRQWQRETHKWYPKFDVEILHDSVRGFKEHAHAKSSESDSDCEEISLDNENGRGSKKSTKRWDGLIDRVLRSESGMLLTTYEQLRLLGEKLLHIEWGYAVLDEGHRIRNPNAEVTLVCKQLQTVHRIIMTGAPIQNKLSELWSLFDFIFPGKLGVLPVFETEFAVPITVGGYANATPLQVSTAYRCAIVLRDLVMPYLLRRMKTDVHAQLPKKTEHVLFCSLTSDQRSVYRAFLASSEVEQIFDGSRNSLYGIDVMRKICNHPDLLERDHSEQNPDYGNPERSGKMKVVAQILRVWKEQDHRVLIFSQTQQTLDILEKYLIANEYIYRRMDGLTPAKQRMALIDEFNTTSEIFVFILTTKVGGLGTNLTGANRVIIYDPDWNPSTDMQARERAWRIGQTKDVTVYRLITRGTIEEKVYHRQIYKHFLTNKILNNPQQKRFFKARDMRDLFTLHEDERGCSTETSSIFGQLSEDINVGLDNSNKQIQKQEASTLDFEASGSSSDSAMSRSKSKGKELADQNGHKDEGMDVLKSLLDANGIHSALNHDAIMNANGEDRVRMEEQASLVAQKAAEALRQSRMLRGRESFAVPTWTGKSGAAGAPSSVKRKFGSTLNSSLAGSHKASSEASSSQSSGFGAGVSAGRALSSAELLARARENRERASSDGVQQLSVSSSNNSSSTVQPVIPGDSRHKQPNKSLVVQPEILIRQLCTFIQQRGGSADSNSIVLHFKERIPPKDLPLFRSLLKEIAVLQKGVGGSHWLLKPEYRD